MKRVTIRTTQNQWQDIKTKNPGKAIADILEELIIEFNADFKKRGSEAIMIDLIRYTTPRKNQYTEDTTYQKGSMVTVTVEDDIYDSLKANSERLGLSISDVLRRLMLKNINR